MPKPAHDVLPEKRDFQRSLLRWYATHKRSLPWRKNGDPYRILVSEFMLQQTRVETVIPYFHRFIRLFPTLQSLAGAPPEKVLAAWAGLGYYARARNLHAAARILCRDHSGEIPSSLKELLRLPGLGAYAAGAVASIAFHRPVPAVDGNVRRVIGRLFARPPFAVSARQTAEQLWATWIPSRRASDFNQAVMDLGAGVCTPSHPRCPECPVRKICGSQGAVRKEAPGPKKVREQRWLAALVEKNGRFLVHRNEKKGLLRGLWQFPILVSNLENGPGEKGLRNFLLEEFGIRVKLKASLPAMVYGFTHIQARIRPYLCSFVRTAHPGHSPEPFRWVSLRAFARYPVSTLMRKIAALPVGRG